MERFWLEKPIDLFKSLNPVPDCNAGLATKMNSLSRMVIVIALFMYALDYNFWLPFLIAGLLAIVLIYYSQQNKGQNNGQRENFSPIFNTNQYGVNNVEGNYNQDDYSQPEQAENVLSNGEEIIGYNLNGNYSDQQSQVTNTKGVSENEVYPSDSYDDWKNSTNDYSFDSSIDQGVKWRQDAESEYLKSVIQFRTDITKEIAEKMSKQRRPGTLIPRTL